MRFEEIRIRGFLSFSEDEQVIKIGKRGLVLIEGQNLDDPTTDSNGSGKSSIPDALLWCLFGTTLRGVSGDDVVHRKAKKGAKVTVVFSNDKGQVFKVERHRGDPVEKNRLLFTGPKGGFTANDTTATEEKIRDALGMDYGTFTSAVVFGQNQKKSFAGMTDKEMKRITDRLIGVESLTSAYVKAKDGLRELEEEAEELQRGKKDLDALRQALKLAKTDHEEWETSRKTEEVTFEKQLKAMKPTTSVADLQAREESCHNAYAVDLAAVEKARELKDEAKSDAKTAEADVIRLTAKLKLLKDTPGQCEHCGQEVSKADLASHRSQMTSEVEVAETEAQRLGAIYEMRLSEFRAADKSSAQSKALFDAAAKAHTEGKAALGKYVQAKALFEQWGKATNPHGKAIERAKDALETAKAHNETVEAALESLRAEVAAQKFLVAMFSDKGGSGLPPLKGLLVESVAPFVNKRLAHYSRMLTEGNIVITFETTSKTKAGEHREHYNLKAVNKYGADAYEGCSGGERRKIDATVFFAFQDLAASRAREQVRFAFFDEIFDALDETAQEVAMELLLEEKKRRDTVFVISHSPDLKASFPSVITVRKSKGFTRVVS